MVSPKNIRWEKIILALWLVLNLGIGVLTVHQYGISVDEPNNHIYADETLDAYRSFFGLRYEPKFDPSDDGHGPAFVTIAVILIRGIQGIFPNAFEPDLWHFIYFTTFQLTGLCLYWMTKRWFDKWTVWGVLILFTTQPLLWGHSFINPKDIPFMFFFTASLACGLHLADSIDSHESFVSLKRLIKSISNKFKEKKPAQMQGGEPRETVIGAAAQKIWFDHFLRALRNPNVLLAGVVLGLATSVRSVAPLVWVIVVLYLFLKAGSKAWATASAYSLITGVSTYLTWPYLWRAPITNFFFSLNTSSRFPYRGSVLFMGNIFPTDQLPRRFFPTLLSLQLTEPALILIFIGLVVSVYLLIKGKKLEPILLFAVWFVPLAFWIIFSHSSLYDNARQLLFLWPALFILAGIGIDQIMTAIKLPMWRVAFIIVMAFPGIYASIRLHPYEYIYYNSLVGGVQGAYRNFELDYWTTSFKESMEYLNQNAEQGATIMVIGPSRQTARQYARSDLTVIALKRVNKSETQPYYILSSTRSNDDISHCKNADVVFSVERDEGILSYIKRIDPAQNCK